MLWNRLAEKLTCNGPVLCPFGNSAQTLGFFTFDPEREQKYSHFVGRQRHGHGSIGKIARLEVSVYTVSSPFTHRNPRGCTLFGRVICQQMNIRAVPTHDRDLSVWLKRQTNGSSQQQVNRFVLESLPPR